MAERHRADLPSLRALKSLAAAVQGPPFGALAGWQRSGDAARAAAACEGYRASSVLGQQFTLPGPTGESNRYQLLPRGAVWAGPQTALGLVHQVAAALASGNPCWLETPLPRSPVADALAALPSDVRALVQTRSAEQLLEEPLLSAMLFEGDGDALQALLPRLAQRQGALIRIESLSPAQLAAGAVYDLSALMHEQSVSTNTAAAGGNAQLMTMG